MLGPETYKPDVGTFNDHRERLETVVVKAIEGLTKLPVIRQAQMAEMPGYPFITFSTINEADDTALYIPPEYESKRQDGLHYTTMYHDVTTTFSLTTRGESANEVKRIARYVRRWLRYGDNVQ